MAMPDLSRLVPSPPPWRVNAVGWPRGNVGNGNDLLRRLMGDRSVEAIVGGVEAFVGFVALLVVVFGYYGVLGGSVLFNSWLYRFPRIDRPTLELLTVGWALLLVLSARSAAFFLQSLETAVRPIPLAVARRWLELPPAARPGVAGWWWGLASSVLLASHWIENHMVVPHPTGSERLLTHALAAVFWYGSAVAVNTNVLIGVAAFTGSEGAVRRMWRMRLALDLFAVALYVSSRRAAV